jgi:hypothetical protein
MRKITFITAALLIVSFNSCADRQMNKEDGADFYNKCIEQAIAYAGADRIDMFMPDYKNKCSCLLNELVKKEIKAGVAMESLEDKDDVFAQLHDVDCN